MIALLAFCCVAIACALLSLVVVSRRWAFIGEGIGHSGFGGAGTAWMLMCLSPALDQPWLPNIISKALRGQLFKEFPKIH